MKLIICPTLQHITIQTFAATHYTPGNCMNFMNFGTFSIRHTNLLPNFSVVSMCVSDFITLGKHIRSLTAIHKIQRTVKTTYTASLYIAWYLAKRFTFTITLIIILPLIHNATLIKNHSTNTLNQCINGLTEFRKWKMKTHDCHNIFHALWHVNQANMTQMLNVLRITEHSPWFPALK